VQHVSIELAIEAVLPLLETQPPGL
jgi:hypothetical protein